MSDIKISNLNSAGSDLFQDSESFLTELEGTSITQEIMGGSGGGRRQTIVYGHGGGYGGGGYGGGGYGGGGYGHGGHGHGHGRGHGGKFGGPQIFVIGGGNSSS